MKFLREFIAPFALAVLPVLLRPTMIYGSPGDRNIIRLVKWINRCPVLPVFGNGKSLQQTFHVTHVAWSGVQVLESPATINRQFNISGANPLTYNDVVRFTSEALNHRVLRLHIPARPMVFLLVLMERFGIIMLIKAEQTRRLNEDKAFSHADANEVFGY